LLQGSNSNAHGDDNFILNLSHGTIYAALAANYKEEGKEASYVALVYFSIYKMLKELMPSLLFIASLSINKRKKN
jgi:hypothetical protein